MASPLGDPSSIRSAAQLINGAAAGLAARSAHAYDSARAVEWQSARADRFRSVAERINRDAQRRAGELRSIAQDLERVAARLQFQIDNISRLERLVRSALNASVETLSDMTGGAVSTLPRAGDPAWERVASKLGIR